MALPKFDITQFRGWQFEGDQLMDIEAENHPKNPWEENALREAVKDDKNIARKASDLAGNILGYFIITLGEDYAFIRKLEVNKNFQDEGKAIEKAMIANAYDWMRRKGKEHLFIAVDADAKELIEILEGGKITNLMMEYICPKVDYFAKGKDASIMGYSDNVNLSEIPENIFPDNHKEEMKAFAVSAWQEGEEYKGAEPDEYETKPEREKMKIPELLGRWRMRLAELTGKEWDVVAQQPNGTWEKLDSYEGETDLHGLGFRTVGEFTDIGETHSDMGLFFNAKFRNYPKGIAGQIVIPAEWVENEDLKKGLLGSMAKYFYQIDDMGIPERRGLKEEDGGMDPERRGQGR